MSKEDKFIFAIMMGATAIGVSIFAIKMINMTYEAPTKIEVVYDCRLAEISVDYPLIVKERCRKLLTPPSHVKG